MSEEFKRKLRLYEQGLLKGEELEQFEEELTKIEQYQAYLEENDDPKVDQGISEVRQKKILRRSKWKARFQTAFMTLVLFIFIMIATSIITAIYYSWGEPDRSDVYANVIDYTLAVTEPYGDFGGTSVNAKPFFRAEMTRNLKKQVGMEHIEVGELKVNFLFSLMGFPERTNFGRVSQTKLTFTFPGSDYSGPEEWDRLEQFPEGRVVSAYVSFNELIGTEEVFKTLEGKDIEPIWFAVDTGMEKDDVDGGIVFEPIGFPAFPIWHEDDMILDSREEQKGFLFGKVVMEGHSSPAYDEGDYSVLHTQFLKTLQFLSKYESKAEKLYGGMHLNLEERIEYLENNDLNHYGVVITGPTKEVLKLQEDALIHTIEVDEVVFWNWR